MKQLHTLLMTVALLSAATRLFAQDAPQMPAPVKEHEWLQKFVGEWVADTDIFMEPGKPPVKSKGVETVKAVGGFWIVGEGTGECMGMTMQNRLTLGYSPEKKKYIGSWIDSMTSTFWTYEGTVDASGKILTLEAEGPCPMKPGTLSKFREVTEFKSPDHRVFSSSILGDDGKWTTMVVVDYQRKK